MAREGWSQIDLEEQHKAHGCWSPVNWMHLLPAVGTLGSCMTLGLPLHFSSQPQVPILKTSSPLVISTLRGHVRLK